MAETEVVLLRRFAASGDAAAFAEITRRHAGLVYGAAWRILSDMDRAGDVAQETFLQLTKDAGGITGSLPGWLHRVATHKAIDVRRRDATRRRREIQYAEGQEREARDWKDISPHVDEGLRALDPDVREMLIAHFLDGQTTRAIAEAQGFSQATVSRRIEAGVNQLRGVLRKRGVIVAVGALAAFLAENSAQGAPAALMVELGKMALVGSSSAASAAATGSLSSLFSTAAGTVVTTVKANAVTFATVALIGAGSVVTYEYVSSSKKGNEPTPVSAPAGVMRLRGQATAVVGQTRTRDPQSASGQPPDRKSASTRLGTDVRDDETVLLVPRPRRVASASKTEAPPSNERVFSDTGMMMGSLGMGSGPALGPGAAADPKYAPPQYHDNYVTASGKSDTDPNDSNDSNSTNP